jgi:hypothetical protein
VNGDFEFWDTIPGTNGLEDPFGWRSNNFGIYTIPGGNFITGISKSNDSYHGNYSLKLNPSNHAFGLTTNSTRAIQTTDTCTFLSSNFGLVNCVHSPVNYHYEKIIGYYKFVPNFFFGDTAQISLALFNIDSINSVFQSPGEGVFWFSPTNIWTFFEMPVYYSFPFVPSNFMDLRITFFSNNNLSNPTGYLLLDSLALVPGIVSNMGQNQPPNLKLYPNPVQEKLVIEISASFNNFELCDLSGRIINSGPFQKEMDVGFLSKGIYFVRLQSEKQILVEKFVKE